MSACPPKADITERHRHVRSGAFSASMLSERWVHDYIAYPSDVAAFDIND
jgi:hypothetical protein